MIVLARRPAELRLKVVIGLSLHQCPALRWRSRVAAPSTIASTRPAMKVMKKTLLTVPGWPPLWAVRLAPTNKATSTMA